MTEATPSVAPLADGISTERLSATVFRLASDEYAGRRVGTAGGAAARTWLADQLREIGALVSHQEFSVSGVADLTAAPLLTYNGSPLTHRRDFVVHPASAPLETPRGADLATTEGATWQGRWVIARSFEPNSVARARSEGAAGLLVPRGTDAAGWMPKLLSGPSPAQIPIMSVRTDLHAHMAAGGGDVRASTPIRRVTVTGTNVHGTFQTPTDGGLILLTAHYDGVGDDPGLHFPAAADNASGVAVVLEAARLLAPVLPAGAGLAVAFLDGEEAGARGSAAHAPHLRADTDVINVDGAGRLGDAAAVEAGGPAHHLLSAVDRAGRETGIRLQAGAVASDNRRYAAAGLAAIGLGMGVRGYHTPADTPDRVEPDTLAAATRLVVATVQHLMKVPT